MMLENGCDLAAIGQYSATDGPAVLVDFVVPTEGALDLNALQQRLQALASSAMVEHVRAAG